MDKNKTIKVKKIKVPKHVSGQFYQAPVRMNNNKNDNNSTLVVELPADVARYLNITENKVYWAAINGVVQLSGDEPNIVIPMIGVRASSFVPQS